MGEIVALPSIRCCGVRIDCIDIKPAVARIVDQALSLRSVGPTEQGVGVHLCNAWTLACSRQDRAYGRRVDAGDLNLPDGMPLVWFARRFGIPMEDRVYGPDLMLGVFDSGQKVGLRHYLYGTTPETLATMRAALESQFPGAEIVAADAPPFRALSGAEQSELVTRIRESQADVVWIGLGTPQQDELVYRLQSQVSVMLIPVGAAFDFIAGQKSQAPAWMQRNGLEWLFRLVSEPRRLWRRYLLGNTRFVIGSIPDIRRALRGGPPCPPAE